MADPSTAAPGPAGGGSMNAFANLLPYLGASPIGLTGPDEKPQAAAFRPLKRAAQDPSVDLSGLESLVLTADLLGARKHGRKAPGVCSQAALLLCDTAAEAGALPLALRASLVAACFMLPDPPPAAERRTAGSVTAPIDGDPPPSYASGLKLAGSAAVAKMLVGLSALADDLAAAGADVVAKFVAGDGKNDVHGVLWRVATQFEHCFWAASPHARALAGAPDLAGVQAVLGAAAAALMSLWNLEHVGQGDDAALAGLLKQLGRLVTARGVPGPQRVPLLRAAAHALVHKLSLTPDGDVYPAYRACVHGLYGLPLSSEGDTWDAVGGLETPPTGFADLMKDGLDACAEAVFLMGQLKGTEDGVLRAALGRSLLLAQSACPGPAPAVLEAWSPETLLFGAEPTDRELLEAAGSGDTLQTMLGLTAAKHADLQNAVAADPATPLCRYVYTSCLESVAAAFAADTSIHAPSAWLTLVNGGRAETPRALADAVRGPFCALRYEPTLHTAWNALACIFAAGADALLADAARAPGRWTGDQNLRRFLYVKLAHPAIRAALVCRAVACDHPDAVAAADEFIGSFVLGIESRCPPAAPRGLRDGRAIDDAVAALTRAVGINRSNWRLRLQLGRAEAKRAADMALRAGKVVNPVVFNVYVVSINHYVHAVALSAAANDGAPALEPFYKLHAGRLRLALALRRGAAREGKPTPSAAIAPLIRWSFTKDSALLVSGALGPPSRRRAAAAACVDGDSDDDVASPPAPPPFGPAPTALKAVIDDALAALAYIVSESPNFHKARYRQARALAALGDQPAALAAVRALVMPASEYGPVAVKIEAGRVACLPHDAALPVPPASETAADALWGGRPRRLSPPGVSATDRGHARCLCAHVRLHARLAAATGDGAQLDAAASYDSQRANVPGLDVAAAAVKKIAARAAKQAKKAAKKAKTATENAPPSVNADAAEAAAEAKMAALAVGEKRSATVAGVAGGDRPSKTASREL